MKRAILGMVAALCWTAAARADCTVWGAGIASTRGGFYVSDGNGGFIDITPFIFGVPYLTGELGFDGRVEIAAGDASGNFDYFSTGNGPMDFFSAFFPPPPTHGRATLTPIAGGATCDAGSFSFDATGSVVHVNIGNHVYDSTDEIVSTCATPVACAWDAATLRIQRNYTTPGSVGLIVIFELSPIDGGLQIAQAP